MSKQQWGRKLACGCVLGYERCMDCRPGLHPDQETALEMTIAKQDRLKASLVTSQQGKTP